MTTDDRIDRLERQLRGLRVALFLAIAALAGAVALGLAAPGSPGSESVSATSFVLRSKDSGRMLGSWGETPAGTAAFSLYNNDGDIAFSIVLDSAGHANLTLRDAGGSPLLVLTSIDGGDPGDPASTWRTGQILVGGSDKVLVSIGATSKATGSLATFDRQGRQLVAVTATEGGQGAVETTRRSYSETGRLHTGQVSAPQPPPEPGPAVWTSRPWHTRWRSARSSR